MFLFAFVVDEVLAVNVYVTKSELLYVCCVCISIT